LEAPSLHNLLIGDLGSQLVKVQNGFRAIRKRCLFGSDLKEKSTTIDKKWSSNFKKKFLLVEIPLMNIPDHRRIQNSTSKSWYRYFYSLSRIYLKLVKSHYGEHCNALAV